MEHKSGVTYLVQVGGEWEFFYAVDIPDLVKTVAEYTGNKSDLLTKALVGCEQDADYVGVYNRFASSYGFITGIWTLGKHIYGNSE